MSQAPADRPPLTEPALPPMPVVDFAQFGEVESQPLSRQQRIGAGFLARNWAKIPHVTHHDEAAIDALEAFRQQLGAQLGVKLTLVPFLLKAMVAALKAFPRFNASLDPAWQNLVLKKYFHLGVAVDTPNGLLVPVIRDCDRKSIAEIAAELAEKAARARGKGLALAEMSGGCCTLSSLGGLGGTGFTPIINAPELAILGVTRAAQKLSLVDGQVRATTVLPLSLSYDHRVINGADAARFTRFLAEQLGAPETLAASGGAA